MRAMKITIMLALIPTFLLCADSVSKDLYGYWFDEYSNTTLEITNSQKGLRVKQHGGLFPKWREYKYLGRGVFDDYDGRVIISRGYNQIEYRNGKRGSVQLYRDSHSSYGSDSYGGDYYDDDSYSSNTYDQGTSDSYGSYNTYASGDQYCAPVSAYCGSWNSYDRGGYGIRIERYRSGFRARYGNSLSLIHI